MRARRNLVTTVCRFSHSVGNIGHTRPLRYPDALYLPDHETVDPFQLVAEDMNAVRSSIVGQLQNENPLLAAAAGHLFELGGKGIRPTSVLLLGRLVRDEQGRGTDAAAGTQGLAEVTEMIHTASLIHDDIIDDSGTRRGEMTVAAKYGNKIGVLVGDYLLARASVRLARLGSLPAVIDISYAIEHLVEGELMQMGKGFGCVDYQGVGVGTPGLSIDLSVPSVPTPTNDHIRHYLVKTFFKTGSLFAHSARSAAVLEDATPSQLTAAFEFGKNIGMAFQLVDDILDVVGSSKLLGKPALHDMRQGQLTAPALIAADRWPELIPMVQRRLAEPGDEDRALEMLQSERAVERAFSLASAYGTAAAESLDTFGHSETRSALHSLIRIVLDRKS